MKAIEYLNLCMQSALELNRSDDRDEEYYEGAGYTSPYSISTQAGQGAGTSPVMVDDTRFIHTGSVQRYGLNQDKARPAPAVSVSYKSAAGAEIL